MKVFDLRKHLDESEDVIVKIIKKSNRYRRYCQITKALRLKRLNRYFYNKGVDACIAGFVLCAKNIDLLLPIIENQSGQKDS
jgi:hypothetical protein